MNSPHHFLKSIFGIGMVATLLTALSACGSGGGQGSAPPPTNGKGMKTLRWYGLAGTATWANTLDPSQVTDSISYNIMGMVNAGLVKLLPSGNAGPDLARSWSISPNRKIYTFHLRANLKFNNGDPLTARDVAWSIQRALAPQTRSPVAVAYLGHILGASDYSAGKATSVSGVKVLDARTIRIYLDAPIAFFLKTLTYPTADVLDKRIVGGHPAQTYITNNCAANVGAGQFMFQCRAGSGLASFYRSGSTPSMTLAPNSRYWGRKPRIRIVMPAIADAQTNYKDFQAGGIDVTAVPSVDIAQNRDKPNFYKFPTSVVDYITPNQSTAPFNNVHCRLAVAYAIDRNRISAILHGTEAPAYSVVPRGMLGWYPGANNPHYDPTRARRELSLCPGGLQGLTLTYQHTSVDIDNEYTAIQSMLAAVGIQMKVSGLTFNGWLGIVGKSLQATGTKLTENLWIEDYPDPYDYMTLLLRQGQNYDIGGFNNAQYNRLVDQAAVEANPARRAQLYRQAQHIALSQGAWISIGNALGYALVNPKVKGLIGAEAFGVLVPRGNDWANVSII